jgi:hypothetical protein
MNDVKLYTGAVVEWSDDEGDNIGVISDMMDGKELVKVKRLVELEGVEESDDEIVLLCEEVKLRTYTMTEKADDSPQEGSLVSWETSIGDYYGDILAITTDGMVRGEPQGIELEGTEERPVYAVRVHMWDDDKGEYFATNSMVVTYSDSLKIIDTIPEPVLEEPNDGEKMSAEIYSTIESQIAEIVKNEVAKALQMISEVKANEQDPGELAGVQATEEPAAEVTAEVAAEEVAAEVVAEVEAEVVAEEVVAEEVVAEVAAEEVAAEEVAPGEEKSFLTFQDLKEFSELIKVL